MKKTKAKPKSGNKEAAAGGNRGQVVKLKVKPRRSFKLPPVMEYWSSTRQFLAEAVQELKKVTWPNRKETLGATGVVLILVIIIAVFLGLVDFGLSRLVRFVVR
jgi:preprotein translocase subunit SecE